MCVEKKVPRSSVTSCMNRQSDRDNLKLSQSEKADWSVRFIFSAHLHYSWDLQWYREVTWKIGVLAEKKGDGESEAIHFASFVE